MKGNKKNIVVTTVLTLTILLSVLVSVFYMHVGSSAKAAAPAIKAHAIKVNPHVSHAVKPDTAGVFPCQNPTYVIHCYGPQQIRKAYDIQPLLDKGINGSGRTIVIVDAFQSPTIVQDLHTFDSTFHLHSAKLNIIAPDGLTPFDPTSANEIGWAEEISLDVEWAHAVAPYATIDLVLAKSNEDVDILSATKYAVNHNLGDVISQSFGENESCVDPTLLAQEHQLFQDATNKHITLLASSGDTGAAQLTCDGTSYTLAVSSPASDPLVTGVGGTQLFANQKSGAYIGEVAWNEPQYQIGSGGGYSVIYHRPDYQKDAVHSSHRGVPDVAYNAAVNGGVLVAVSVIPSGAEGGPFHIFGGTSAGSPQWAGIVALANHAAGHRIGFLNPAVYAIGQSSDYSKAFHDILFGNNTITLTVGTGTVTVIGYSAHKGWDAVTGWGSPKANGLVDVLAHKYY